MKIALTGSGGMLGSAIKNVFSGNELIKFTRDRFDITVLNNVVKQVKEAKPDFLVHAAAFTDVDRCETEPEMAYLINGLGTRNIAMACEEIKCPVVYISTDYVFNGEKGSSYDEWDAPNPINKYGLSKLMGERFISSLTNRFYIIRTSWLYGKNGKNFVDTIIKLLSDKDTVEVVHDRNGCPTYTIDLAKKILEILGKGYGTYHITNAGSCSWYDLALKIAKLKGFNKEIIPVTSEHFKRPAPRPANSVLNSTMLKLEGVDEEALKEYLDH